jgi:biotin carboxyl carrier protein
MIEGKVGSKILSFKSAPRGKTGEAVLEINGKPETIQWKRDEQGIWLQTSQGFFGFDARRTTDDDGNTRFQLLRRKDAQVTNQIAFLKAGEGDTSGTSKVKKNVKVKSQMPGKIVRVLVSVGSEVKKGQSLLVMEAMKMENEIKCPQDGVIKEVKVSEGQAVETGAELLSFI